MTAVKKNRQTKVYRLVLVIALAFLTIFGGTFFYYQSERKPVTSISQSIYFSILPGQSAKRILKNLEAEDIIRNAQVASFYMKMNSLTDLKAGEYLLDPSWTLEEILVTLNNPTAAISNDVRITFIEGDWLKHMADKIDKETSLSSEELLELWNSEVFVRSLMADYPFLTEEIFNESSRYLLEGYLFPSTYDFYRETTAEEVTKKLLNQTLKIYNKYKSDIEKSDLSIHEIFTLASIVQYEAGSVNDMKLIAGVFYNRLDIGMKLQSSVTICYALDLESGKDWRKCETNPNFDSPYNTYKYSGLPPGPILNPGEAAIEATLQPTNSDYYYFMADVYNDGTVYYAKTLQEHEANVDKYLR